MGKVERQKKRTAGSVVKDIRRQTRRKFSSEEKIRIVLEEKKGEDSISEICRKEGIAPALSYRWSKDFIEADKRRLNGDTEREANSFEVDELRKESAGLKMLVTEQALELRKVKKSLSGLKLISRSICALLKTKNTRSSDWLKTQNLV